MVISPEHLFQSESKSVSELSSQAPASLGFPGYYYTSSDIFERELKTLWRHAWQMIGRVEDVPNPGDYLTCMVGEEPIFVLRQPDGTLRAMHNVCPHRGARLLNGRGHCGGRITCPYHAWTYSTQGQLLGVSQPDQFPYLDKGAIALTPARVETWGGFIFVNPDPDGESLTDYLAGFPAYLEHYPQPWDALREVMRWTYDEPVNWKFVVENYVEDYHFATVHPESLNFFDFQTIRTRLTGRHCEVHVPYATKEPLDEDQKHRWAPNGLSYQGFIFPNMMVNADDDHVSVFRLVPIRPTRTVTEVMIYQTPAQQRETPVKRDRLKANFDRVMEEDFSVCRLLQAGVHSRAYRVSHLATERELGITHFHRVLRDYLE